jgi:hypothetical protein
VTAAPVEITSDDLPSLVRSTIGMALLATAIALLVGCLSTSELPTQAVVWGGLALAAYSFGLLFLVARQDRSLGLARWRFGSWILVWYGVAFGLATLTWSDPQSGAPAQIAVSSVLRALWLVSVGLAAWMLGYLAGPGPLAERVVVRRVEALRGRFAQDVRSTAAPWILYGIGGAARLTEIVTSGHFGYVGNASAVLNTATSYQQALSLLSLCAPLAVAAAALQVYREKIASARITLVVLFVAEFAFAAAAGGKQNFIIAVLGVVVPYSATRKKLPSPLILAALAIVFLTLIIPFSQTYKSTARNGTTTLSTNEAFATAPNIIDNIIQNYNPESVIPNSLSYLFHRIREIDSPAIIMQRTPGQIGYSSPLQLVEDPISGMIPRALWPGKPILASGYQVSQQYYGLSATVYNSSAITPVADFYRHGGWPPVLIGMFVFGCAVRLLDNVLDIRSNPHAIFLILLLFPTVVKNETDWLGLVVGIPATVLMWFLAVSLTFRSRRAVDNNHINALG